MLQNAKARVAGLVSRPATAATLVAIGVAIAGVALDWYLLPGRRSLLYSDLFAGIVAGVLSYVALRNYQLREQLLLARMRVVAEMNHHVRNALTPLSLVVQLSSDRELVELMRNAVARIDWALKTVLPARDVPEGGEAFPPATKLEGESARQ